MRPCDRLSRARIAGAILLVVAAIAGCTTQGHPNAERPDLTALDVGFNSTEPLTEPVERTATQGRILESVRMGETIIDPVEADPALMYGLRVNAVPLPTPAAVTRILSAPVRAVLDRHRMLAGFTSVGSDKEQLTDHPVIGSTRLLTVVLLRFPDAEAAGRAAREIDAVDAAVSPENVAVRIPDHPAAAAHWRPTAPTLAATIAQDSFVVSLLVGHTSPDIGALTGLAGAAFDAQIRRLRDFAPTPAADFDALPLDRDRMLARLLPEVPDKWPYPKVVATDYVENAGWHADFELSGVVLGPHANDVSTSRGETRPPELVAINGLNRLERYVNATAARLDYQDTVGGTETSDLQPVAGPPGWTGDVTCYRQWDVPPRYPLGFSCLLLHGRYLALIRGRDLPTVHQNTTAQLALLMDGE